MISQKLILSIIIFFSIFTGDLLLEPESEPKKFPFDLLEKLPPLLENQLYVGYSKKCTDPKEGPIPLGGFGNSFLRQADVNNQPYKQSLYGTTVALMDSEGSITVLITLDILGMIETTSLKIRSLIEKEVGIPRQNITISATHTHSGPESDNTSGPKIPEYIELLKTTLLQGVKEALEDLTPAYAYVGSTKVILENGKNALNFVRHYSTKNVDKFGKTVYSGPAHGWLGWNGTHYVLISYKDHTRIADNELQLIRFDFTLFNKKDVILANFRAHCTMTGGNMDLVISADWVAGFRDNLEKSKNCRVAYFAGAAGDTVPNTFLSNIGEGIEGITHKFDEDPTKEEDLKRKERSIEYGRILSEYALKIYGDKNNKNNNLEQVRLGKIINSNTTVKLQYRLFSQEEIILANYTSKFWGASDENIEKMICGTYDWGKDFSFPKGFDKTGKTIRELIRHNFHISKKYYLITDEGVSPCKVTPVLNNPSDRQSLIIKFIGASFEKTIHSIYHADTINRHGNHKEGDSKQVKIQAVNIGDISFACAPYEMFNNNGKMIKDKTKTKMTFVLTSANGKEGYIPSEESFDYGCYEADTSAYQKGCGEALGNGFIKIINDNYQYNFARKYIRNISLFILFIALLF